MNNHKAALFAVFCLLTVATFSKDSEEQKKVYLTDTYIKKPHNEPWRRIVSVSDGDTIKLDNDETVRLIGVDAPESRKNQKLKKDVAKMQGQVDIEALAGLGKEATVFVKSIAAGRYCWLEYDSKKYDRYGRTLAYVHFKDGGTLNEIIIRSGYGRAYLEYPFAKKRNYYIYQQEAQRENKGLWNIEEKELKNEEK